MSNARRFGGAGIRRGIRSPGGGAAPRLFSPLDLTPDFWMRTDQGAFTLSAAGVMTGLSDRSGNGSDVARTSGTAQAPVMVDPAFAGHCGVNFGVVQALQAGGTPAFAGAFTIFGLVNATVIGANQMVFAGGSGSLCALFFHASGFRFYCGTAIDAGGVTTGLVPFCATRDGSGNGELYVGDWDTPAVTGAVGTSTMAADMLIGAQTTAGGSFRGSMAEIVRVGRVITTEERRAAAQYLNRWYDAGITATATADWDGVVAPAPLKIYLLTGQSNMSGDSDGGSMPTSYDDDMWMNIPYDWDVNGSATGTVTPIREISTDVYSVEIALAQRLLAAGTRAAIVKTSEGSTDMRWWEPGVTPPSGTNLWADHKTRVAAFVADVTDYEYAGLIHYQGESDAGDATRAADYARAEGAMFADARTTYGASLPILDVQLHPDHNGTSYTLSEFSTVHAAKITNAATYSTTLVDQTGAGLIVGEEIHLTGAGRMLVGERCADGVL